MTNISLENKVVILTGAGRGLGRAYALLLAEKGARVVVNDLGTDVDGKGSSSQVAQEVVDLIVSRGGLAVANGDDVSSEAGGRAMVQQALDAYGALDVVVNNAGIGHELPFEKTTLRDFEHHWRIHVGGHINVSGAAWPIMMKQKKRNYHLDKASKVEPLLGRDRPVKPYALRRGFFLAAGFALRGAGFAFTRLSIALVKRCHAPGSGLVVCLVMEGV